MTPEDRAKQLWQTISDHQDGANRHEEAWVDLVWHCGPALAAMTAAIRDAVVAERERCVKVAEDEADVHSSSDLGYGVASRIAARIREGGVA